MNKQQKIQERGITNFALLLNKVDAFESPNKLAIKKLSKRDSKTKREIGRCTVLEGFIFPFDSNFWTNLKERQMEFAASVCSKTTIPIAFSPDWRMVVGLGNPSVYETSITLHHVYGFPYIPGSAIKGVVRNWIINNFFDLTNEERGQIAEKKWGDAKEDKALQDKGFCQLFGCSEGSAKKTKDGKALAFIGDLIFFDAYPIQNPNISMDTMTVHYPKYYGEGTLPPADWQNPIPIPFLTLKNEGTKINQFQFVIGLRKGATTNVIIGKEDNPKLQGDILQVISFCLKLALTQHGIGAKTAVGYGYMQ